MSSDSISRTMNRLRRDGVAAVLKDVMLRLRRPSPHPAYAEFRNLFIGKRGLEVGGPSALFRKGSHLPVYAVVNEIDNCKK